MYEYIIVSRYVSDCGGKSMFLNSLKDNNQYPILFIGAGITRRYFEDAPTWDGLLKKLWGEINESRPYEAKYHELSENQDDSFQIYLQLADYIEKRYDQMFYNGELILNGLTPEEAHNSKQSPFRTRIAEIYSHLTPKASMKEELRYFKAMLAKARMIVTTNYDTFIEDQLNQAITVHIGNEGLFEVSDNICELYKIHGSIKKPNSIVISTADYNIFARTSAIVNAKILSLLTESPILFFGYSLTDYNVKSLLSDLVTNMPFSLEEKAKRIGVIKYEPGYNKIDQVLQSMHDNIVYTMLKTDNFAEVYNSISCINQGISPIEISKYIHLLRQIIVEQGHRGTLDSVLTSIGDLDSLSSPDKRKNLVVALGDMKYLYRMPTYVDYIKSYFGYAEEMPVEIALSYISKTPANSTLPVSKYKQYKQQMDPNMIEKFDRRCERFSDLDSLKSGISIPQSSEIKLNEYKKRGLTLIEMLSENDNIKYKIKFAYALLHYEEFPDQVEMLVKHILSLKSNSIIEETNARKLFLGYSLYNDF